jgi:formylglycine-generating enzyme required for sulfatase activity
LAAKQVFISHATAADGAFAQRLAGDLRRLGMKVWIAPESIRSGEEWVDAIERGLGESSHIVIVLTPAALVSPWVRKETNVAIALERQGGIRVIPLHVEPCEVPLLLSSYQMISFRRNYDAGLSRLARDLGLSVAPAEPVPAPRQAPQHLPEPEVVSTTILERPQPSEPELILIPAGDFLMGSDPKKDKGAYTDEQPQHTLYLPDYYLAKTAVTNTQYAAFVEATDHKRPEHWKDEKPPKGKEDHPVVEVSWHDAEAYCNWLAQVTGKAYRLPSEAEWEKGARGTDGRIYPWGNDWDPKRCNSKEGGPGDTTPVGVYPQGASPYGLLDMAGNVWEWCRSLYKPYPYDAKDGREDPKATGHRVVRGGAFYDNERGVRCAYRYGHLPIDRYRDRGLRLVVAPL